MKQLPFNYDNFKKLHDKCEDLEELLISTTSQLAVAESKLNSKPMKEKKNADKQPSKA